MSLIAPWNISEHRRSEQGQVSAEIIDFRVAKLSRDPACFDASRDRADGQIAQQKQRVKAKLVAHGSMRGAKNAPPANHHDWPGWFQTPAFQRWLLTAKGIQATFGPEYRSHRNVLGRCRSGRNEIDPAFSTFRNFLAWAMPNIGRRPSELHTLDRINSADLTYGPGRVRWADKAQQAENRRSTKRIVAPDGLGTSTIRVVANTTGTKADTIRARLRRGWSQEEALTGRRVGTRGDPAALPNLWPPDVDAVRHARAYAVFLAALGPEWRDVATRRVFLWALYVPTAKRAAEAGAKVDRAAAWLQTHKTTADLIVAKMADRRFQSERAMIENWLSSTTGSHEHRCGCIHARHGVALAKFELGWLTKPPAQPALPAPPPPAAWWDHTDPADIDPGDINHGDD